MFTALAPFALLGPMLAAATVSDLRSRTITNSLNTAILLLSPVSWWLLGLELTQVGLLAALAGGMFLYFALMFRLGQMGGGDVKFGAALVLWLRPGEVLLYLIGVAIAGGLVTLATFIWHKRTRRTGPVQTPYGLALVAGALLIFAQRYLNHFG